MWQYIPNFYSDSKANSLLEVLINTMPWEQNYYDNGSYKVRVPRQTCWFSPYSYDYAGVHHEKLIPNIGLQLLINEVAHYTNVPFNSVLMNYYKDHNDSVGFHDDNDYPNGGHDEVASISLGAARQFLIKSKRTKLVDTLLLENGSLLLMQSGMQKLYQHSLPKEVIPRGPRVNLTFRHVVQE